MSHRRLAIGTAFKGKVEAISKQGATIEDFEKTLGQGFATYVYNVAGAAPLVQWTAVYGNATASPPRLLGCPTWLSTSAHCVFEEPPREVSTKDGSSWRTVLDAIPSRAPLALMSAVEREEHAKSMILAHARWDSSDNREILTWLSLASRLPEWPDIVKQRLTRDPLEIVSLRIQYDEANANEKKRLEIELRKLVETHPENPDLQYLKIRMLPDGPEQDTAFIEAYRKWPDSLWLCYTAALSYDRTGDWQAAKECFEKLKSSRLPTYDLVAFELARIRRFESKYDQPNLSDLKDCLPLNQLLAFESGEGASGITSEAAFMLHHGRVAEAHAAAISTKDQAMQINAALSTGADPAWVDNVLAIPVAEVTMNFERLYLAAIAARRGLPYEHYLEIDKEASRSEISQALLTKLRKWLASGREASAESFGSEDFNGLLAEERGVLIQAWLLYAPEKATVDLAHAAQTLLFTAERPYLANSILSGASTN